MKGLKHLLNKITTPLEKRCSECDTNLVEFKFGEHTNVICPECARNAHAERDKALANKWAKESLKAKQWAYFKQNSVFNNKGLLDAGFKNLDTKEALVEKAKNIAIKFIKLALDDENKHFILSGKSGTGKSHIAMATARTLVEYDKSVLFVHYATFLEEVRSSYDNDELKPKIRKLLNEINKADILVLDDIGVDLGQINDPDPPSRFNIERLNLILERREDKPLIVTTNLTDSQIKELYGERNYSRMFNHSKGFRTSFNNVTDKRIN